MRATLTVMLLALLAACAAPKPAHWRDTSQPIASAAMFEPDRFAGQWHVVARYPRAADRACPREIMEYGADTMLWRCMAADGRPLHIWQGPAHPQRLPGRMTTDLDGFGMQDFWVLWADFDYRTAVIGTPGGEAGYILNRDPNIPADRMAAAREMLDFNGYALAGLVTLAP